MGKLQMQAINEPKRLRRAHLSLITVCAVAWCTFQVLPSFADASLIQKADQERDKQRYDEAISLYRRAAQEEQINRMVAFDRLYKLFIKLRKNEDAEATLVELKRMDKRYRAKLAEFYQFSGNFYAAQRQFEEEVAEDPTNQDAVIGLGECLEATGNYDAARDYYNRAANMPGDQASYARQKLLKIKNASSVTAIDVDSEVGRWPAERMPLKVFVNEPKDVRGYRAHLRGYVLQAIADWNAAAHGLVKMEEDYAHPEKADIIISWVEQLPGALGIMHPEFDSSGNFKRALILLAANSDSMGNALPTEGSATRNIYEARDRMMREVSLHELGHALGLNHSPRSDDIMANGVFGLHSADVPSARSLRSGDIERLTQLYSAPQSEVEKIIAAANKKFGAPGSTQPEGDGAETGTAPSTVRTPRGGTGIRIESGGVKPTTYKDPTEMAMHDILFNLSTGNYASCVTQLKRLLSEQPTNPQAHYLLAVAYVNLRQFGEATKQYEEVLKLQPKGKLAELASAGLAKIKH